MNDRSRVAAVSTLAAAWAIAVSPLPVEVRALAGFVAVFLLPGVLLERVLGGAADRRLALPGHALALSIGLVAALGFVSWAAGLSIGAMNVMLAAACACLSLAPAARESRRSWSAPDTERRSDPARRALLVVAALTAAAVVLAAVGINVARDRMWYAAYVTHLASGAAVDWNDPVLGTGRVVWRFAHNSWLLALGAWSALSAAPAPWLIERCAPPLLVALVPSASYSLGHALFRDRTRALVTTLCSLVVLLASRYPYFAPDHTPLMARLVEDKTSALVLLAPVAIALAVRALDQHERRPSARRCVSLSLAMLGVALAHGIVYVIVCISIAAFAGARCLMRHASVPRAAAVIGLVAFIGLAPGALGIRARHDALRARVSAATVEAEATLDPVVRAHVRMHRLREIPIGGPIVEPRLLAEPLLLVALAALGVAFAAVGTTWGAYAFSTTLVFLMLAFAPFVAPAFGRAVVPWMAYRALWGIPFGVLLAGAVQHFALSAPERISRAHVPRTMTVFIVTAGVIGLAALPWPRLRSRDDRLSPDTGTRAVLEAVAGLPAGALIAAAPGLAELIPAYAGRPVLAFADRGTVAIAARREDALRRLRANAAIVGLHGQSRAPRRTLMTAHHVTHVVYEHARCDAGTTSVYEDARFRICAIGPVTRADRDEPFPGAMDKHGRSSSADVRWTPPRPAESLAPHERVVATLASGIECRPRPYIDHGLFRWRRRNRWSGEFTSVTCTAELPPATSLAGLRLLAHVPHAREALVYAVSADGADGRCRARSGAVELTNDRWAELSLACARASSVRIRLVPAYLPYLNVSALEVVATD